MLCCTVLGGAHVLIVIQCIYFNRRIWYIKEKKSGKTIKKAKDSTPNEVGESLPETKNV